MKRIALVVDYFSEQKTLVIELLHIFYRFLSSREIAGQSHPWVALAAGLLGKVLVVLIGTSIFSCLIRRI